MEYVKAFLVVFPLLLIADGLWLGLLAPQMYTRELNPLMRSSLHWPAAFAAYCFLAAAPALFVIPLPPRFFGLIVWSAFRTYCLWRLSDDQMGHC